MKIYIKTKKKHKNMKDIKHFINESLIDESQINEKLNYKNKITKKICKAFGFTEQDDFTDAVDNWVTDNNVKNVEFYVRTIRALHNNGVPQSIVNIYSDDRQIVPKLEQSIKKSAEILAQDDDGFMIRGNSKVLSFAGMADANDLYAYNK